MFVRIFALVIMVTCLNSVAIGQENRESIYLNPGSTFGTPIGYGAGSGQGFVGVAATDGVGRQNGKDGSAVVGGGIGDPQKAVALEATVSVISIFRHFGSSGTVNAKIHKWLPYNTGGAIGVENIANWGFARSARIKPSVYGVLTKVFVLDPHAFVHEKLLTLSLGAGNGRFQSAMYLIPNRNAVVNKPHGIGPFGSAGWQFHRKASLVGSWTGRDLNIGFSTVPFSDKPIVATFGAVDVLHRNQPVTRYVVAVGYAFL